MGLRMHRRAGYTKRSAQGGQEDIPGARVVPTWGSPARSAPPDRCAGVALYAAAGEHLGAGNCESCRTSGTPRCPSAVEMPAHPIGSWHRDHGYVNFML